jgi:hypothetical protein
VSPFRHGCGCATNISHSGRPVVLLCAGGIPENVEPCVKRRYFSQVHYLGSFVVLVWGVAHLFPTRSVARAFGHVPQVNGRITSVEWITEGVALISLAAVVATVAYVDHTNLIPKAIYWIAFLMLNMLSVVSLFTGFKVSFLPSSSVQSS